MASFLDMISSAWRRANDNNAGLLAAGIAYYAFLSIMPLLAAMVLSYGLVVDQATLAEHSASLARTLPPSAGELITEQLESVVDMQGGASGLGLVVALALSLFGARVAAGAVMNAFNVAFAAEENRGMIKSNVLAIGITFGAVAAFGLVGITTAFVSGAFGDAGGAWISYAVFLLAGFLGAGAAYFYVPNTARPPIAACAIGAALFAPGWMLASLGFGAYASNVANYNATYGSLGAIVVLLTWLFLSAYLLLLGAHLAAVRSDRVAD